MSPPPLFFVCVGGATVDRLYRAPAALVPGTSNPVAPAQTAFGGVARNVADNLARLGARTALLSVVGDDEAGEALARNLDGLGIEPHLAVAPDYRTAEYVAVLQPDGDLAFGLAAMAVFDALTPALIDAAWPTIGKASCTFADCNLSAGTLRHLIERCRADRFRLAVDTVSTPKALRLPEDLTGVACLFTNRDEAGALLGTGDAGDEALARGLLARGAAAAVITLGGAGALAAYDDTLVRLPAPAADVVDVTGAGDALIAGTLLRLVGGQALEGALRAGLCAAALTTEVGGSVRRDLSEALLQAAEERIGSATDL